MKWIVIYAVSRFQNTKLERAGRLAEDLEFFKSEYGLEPSTSGNDGPGEAYSGWAHQYVINIGT